MLPPSHSPRSNAGQAPHSGSLGRRRYAVDSPHPLQPRPFANQHTFPRTAARRRPFHGRLPHPIHTPTASTAAAPKNPPIRTRPHDSRPLHRDHATGHRAARVHFTAPPQCRGGTIRSQDIGHPDQHGRIFGTPRHTHVAADCRVGVLAVATTPQPGLDPGGRRTRNRVQTAKTLSTGSPEWTLTTPAPALVTVDRPPARRINHWFQLSTGAAAPAQPSRELRVEASR